MITNYFKPVYFLFIFLPLLLILIHFSLFVIWSYFFFFILVIFYAHHIIVSIDVPIYVLRLLMVQLLRVILWRTPHCPLHLLLLDVQTSESDGYRSGLLPHLRLRWLGLQPLLLGKCSLCAEDYTCLEQIFKFEALNLMWLFSLIYCKRYFLWVSNNESIWKRRLR